MLKIINKKKAVELIRRFVKTELENKTWYQDIIKHLIAIILYGSIAKGENRSDSDIDILLVLPLEIEEKYTVGEYSYLFEEIEVNIVIRSIEKIQKIAKEKNDLFQKEVFRDAEIVWDRDGKIAILLKEIETMSDKV